MIDLRRDVLDDFAEAQQLARRDAPLVRGGDDEQFSLATRRRPERPLTKLEAQLLAELWREPRVARAGRALGLGSAVTRKTVRRLQSRRLIRIERLKNKRGTLVARFVRGGFYD